MTLAKSYALVRNQPLLLDLQINAKYSENCSLSANISCVSIERLLETLKEGWNIILDI
jgi:hypothetical protein